MIRHRVKVRRCAHVYVDDDAAEVEIEINVGWTAGMAPEDLKVHVKKATDKIMEEVTFLA
jgi:hypothetical protein